MRSLGRYALTEEIGRGSMGTVYKASDPLIERTAEETIFEEFANHLLGTPSRFLQLARSSGAAA